MTKIIYPLSRLYFWIAFLNSVFFCEINSLNAQCTWHTLVSDGFEYTTACPDIIPGTVYQTTPQTFAAHTGSRSLYLNFVNCVGGTGSCAGTLAYQRTIPVCPNLQMRLSAWLTTTFAGTQCNVHLKIVDANNVVLVNTPSLLPPYRPTWTQYQSGTFTPTTSTIQFLLYTNVGGGGGNDLSMDDFLVENCYVTPSSVSINYGNICQNASPVNLFSSLTNNPVTTGIWAGPTSLTGGNSGTFTPSVNTSGTYTYTSYPFGGSATCPVENDNVTINVVATPVIGITVTPSSTVCSGTIVTLGGTGAAAYAWSGGIGNGVPFSAISTTTYTVTGVNASGCISTSTQTITVNTLPIIGTAITPAAAVCVGTNVTLSGTGGSSYIWSGGITDAVPFSALSSNTYTVTGTDVNGCVNTATQTITVNALPSVGSIAFPGTTVCNGTNVTLTGTGANTYTWTGGITDGTPFSANATTTYTVTGTDINGCVNTSTETISISPLPVIGVNVSPSASVCVGTNVTLSGTGAATYIWSGGITDAAPFIANTSSTYTLTGTDGNGCTNTASQTITVNPLPTVGSTISPSGIVCSGSNVTLAGTGATSYAWTGGITDATPFFANTTSTYTVTGTDANGCVNTSVQTLTVNPLPTVGVTVAPSATVCNGTNVTLSGSGAATYTWTGGITDATPFSATATGTYTVTGTDINGCINTSTQTITVNSLPNVGANISPSASVCSGTSVTLTGTGAATYIWTGGVTDATPFVATATSTYTVTGTDINGCVNTATQVITVIPQPIVGSTVSPSATVCVGTNITLNGTGANSYTWTGGITNGTSFTAVTTSTYTVTGTDVNGCVNTATQTITVNPLPIIGINVSPSILVCSGTSVTLSGTGAASYSWSGGITDSSPFTATSTNTYTVTGTSNGCSATNTITITIAPNINVTVNSASMCPGSSAVLTAAGASVYTWSPAAGLNTTSGNLVIAQPAATQSYTVTGTSNGCTGTAISVVSIFPQPVISYSITPQNGNAPLNVSFSNLTPGTNSCIWNFGDGNFSTAQNSSNIYTVSNTYMGSLIVTDINNCADTVEFSVFVENNATLYIPNAFSPNGDGINDYFLPKGESIKVFEMWIYDKWGEEIYKTDTLDKPWDGRYQQNFCQQDVYVYKIRVTDFSGTTSDFKGKLSLIK